MKKFLVLFFILFASLSCTACINNIAVQELNQIGKEYLEKGDVDNAISRFKSVVDLDENLYETRYNLAVAYIQKEEYNDALPQLEKVMELKPNFADAYYSYAVALEGVAIVEEENSDDPSESDTNSIVSPVNVDIQLLEKSIKYYNKYLQLNPNGEDKAAVAAHIQDLQSRYLDTPQVAE